MMSDKENLDFQLNIRLTNIEGKALKLVADAAGQTKTNLVRSVVRPILQTVIAAQTSTIPTERSQEKAG